jgi:uncharacterized membrane protein YdbT with pleckstrin-like domain
MHIFHGVFRHLCQVNTHAVELMVSLVFLVSLVLMVLMVFMVLIVFMVLMVFMVWFLSCWRVGRFGSRSAKKTVKILAGEGRGCVEGRGCAD